MTARGPVMRQRILGVLGVGVASPSQIAQRLGEPVGNVSYHVKILLDDGALELVDTRPVRGAIEHFYRATLGRGAAHASRTPLRLDAAGRRAVAELLEGVPAALARIEAESAARLAGAEPLRSEVVLLHVERG